MIVYKPGNHNSLSPYLIVDDAQQLVDLLKCIFAATELRRFDHENGPLANKIKQYGFFSYSANEALHLSDDEKETIISIFKKNRRRTAEQS